MNLTFLESEVRVSGYKDIKNCSVVGDQIDILPWGRKEYLYIHPSMRVLLKKYSSFYIVLDPLVSEGCTESTLKESDSLKMVCSLSKNKKKAHLFPDPKTTSKIHELHSDRIRYYRMLLLVREARDPILFVGYDHDPSVLDSAFWVKANEVRVKFHNPKAPRPLAHQMLIDDMPIVPVPVPVQSIYGTRPGRWQN